MARIHVPLGEGLETARVWSMLPEMGAAVPVLSKAVYKKSRLPARLREAVRMRIAQLNDCPI
jgi:alkylhydroperoxidase family enzyme